MQPAKVIQARGEEQESDGSLNFIWAIFMLLSSAQYQDAFC